MIAACSIADNAAKSSGSYDTIDLSSENYDPADMHDTSVNPSRITIPAGLAGYYLMVGVMEVNGAVGGYGGLRFLTNGTDTSSQLEYPISGAYIDSGNLTFDVQYLNGGEYVELETMHSAGGSQTIYGRLTLARLATEHLFVGTASGATITDSTYTAVSLTEQIDTDGWHDNSTNPSKVEVTETGRYLLLGYGAFAANATAGRLVSLYKNGTRQEEATNVFSGVASAANNGGVTYAIVDLTAGDDVELYVTQYSGGDLTLSDAKFAVVKIADADVCGYVAGSGAAQNITADTWAALTLGSEKIDDDGWHDNATNPSRMTCQTEGTFVVLTKALINTSSVVGAGARVGGVAPGGLPFTLRPPTTGAGTTAAHMNLVELSVSDILELYCYNGAGATRAPVKDYATIAWLRLEDISVAIRRLPQIIRRR